MDQEPRPLSHKISEEQLRKAYARNGVRMEGNTQNTQKQSSTGDKKSRREKRFNTSPRRQTMDNGQVQPIQPPLNPQTVINPATQPGSPLVASAKDAAVKGSIYGVFALGIGTLLIVIERKLNPAA